MIRPLEPAMFGTLADALGDSPETVISWHLLSRGLCRAYVVGPIPQLRAAVVQSHEFPFEPTAFGDDVEAIWTLLQEIEAWQAVNVSEEIASDLAAIVQRETKRPPMLQGDLYHVLDRPVALIVKREVLLLDLEDLALIEAIPAEHRPGGWGSSDSLLREGVVAAAVVDGSPVSKAHTSARSPRHADIGVHTERGWRTRGLATAAASVVCRVVQDAGQTPVWSAAHDNEPSLRIAARLGFKQVAQRAHVIRSHESPFRHRDWGRRSV